MPGTPGSAVDLLCTGREPAREVCGTSGKKCLRKGGSYWAEKMQEIQEAEKMQEIQEDARAGGTPELEQRRNKKHIQAGGTGERERDAEGKEEKQERCQGWRNA